jgi:hypothetical protein
MDDVQHAIRTDGGISLFRGDPSAQVGKAVAKIKTSSPTLSSAGLAARPARVRLRAPAVSVRAR